MDIIYKVYSNSMCVGVERQKILTTKKEEVLDFLHDKNRRYQRIGIKIYLDGDCIHDLSPQGGLFPEEAEVVFSYWMEKIQNNKGEDNEES